MTETFRFILNNTPVETSRPAGSSTLDFIRKERGLTGTKVACREGECGACAVLLGVRRGAVMNYRAVASCLLPLGELNGKHLVTVEGLNPPSGLNPVQQALWDESASQCGFCTPGIVLSLTGFLLTSPQGDDQDALDALDGNICRCTGYAPIRRAAFKLAQELKSRLEKESNPPSHRTELLTLWGVLPDYFPSIPSRLAILEQDSPPAAAPINEASPDRVLVAGGTDLFVQKGRDLENCRKMDFISRCSDMNCIHIENNRVVIGAAAVTEDLKNSPILRSLIPEWPSFMRRVASSLMRNRATVAGNIINASPIGDLSIILLALDASLTLKKKNLSRTLPLKDFFKGYKSLNREPGEIIAAVDFPIPGPGWLFHFEKVSRRKHLDIASCNSAIALLPDASGGIKSVRISAGGVAPIPLLLEKTNTLLSGKPLSPETLRLARETPDSEISPISDVRGSAAYKRLLLRQLITAHFSVLFPGKELL